MFSIKLYVNATESNRVDKSNYLTLFDTISGTLKETTSIVNPTITIEYDFGTNNTLNMFNYAYIEKFGRYYFVDDIKCKRNNLWELTLRCDVLMSFKNKILSHYALIDRCEDSRYYNRYLRDNFFIVDTNPKIKILYDANNQFFSLPNEDYTTYGQYEYRYISYNITKFS